MRITHLLCGTATLGVPTFVLQNGSFGRGLLTIVRLAP